MVVLTKENKSDFINVESLIVWCQEFANYFDKIVIPRSEEQIDDRVSEISLLKGIVFGLDKALLWKN